VPLRLVPAFLAIVNRTTLHGTPVKLAYASKAVQNRFGMEEPALGRFYMNQRLPDGSRSLVVSSMKSCWKQKWLSLADVHQCGPCHEAG
jgi:hypothetical protein